MLVQIGLFQRCGRKSCYSRVKTGHLAGVRIVAAGLVARITRRIVPDERIGAARCVRIASTGTNEGVPAAGCVEVTGLETGKGVVVSTIWGAGGVAITSLGTRKGIEAPSGIKAGVEAGESVVCSGTGICRIVETRTNADKEIILAQSINRQHRVVADHVRASRVGGIDTRIGLSIDIEGCLRIAPHVHAYKEVRLKLVNVATVNGRWRRPSGDPIHSHRARTDAATAGDSVIPEMPVHSTDGDVGINVRSVIAPDTCDVSVHCLGGLCADANVTGIPTRAKIADLNVVT